MGLVSGIELLLVLGVVGVLLLLGIRIRISHHTVLLLTIIALLFLALISLTKIMFTLLGVLVTLGMLVLLFALSFIRRTGNPGSAE
jgi:hypothetical protein